MEGYELVFITNPGINDADLGVVLKKFKKSLKDSGGKLIHEYVWGSRRLAYEINGNQYGVYHAWYFTGNGKTVDEMQRQFGYSDEVLRNQIVKTDDIQEEVSFLSKLIKDENESQEKTKKIEMPNEITNQDFVEGNDEINLENEVGENELVPEDEMADEKKDDSSKEEIDTN